MNSQVAEDGLLSYGIYYSVLYLFTTYATL